MSKIARDWLYVSPFRFADEMPADDPAFLDTIRKTGKPMRVGSRAANVIERDVAEGYVKTVGELRENIEALRRSPNFGRKCEELIVAVLKQTKPKTHPW